MTEYHPEALYPAYRLVQEVLTEMQVELMQHNWPESERTSKALELRLKLWDAIGAYRDDWLMRQMRMCAQIIGRAGTPPASTGAGSQYDEVE